MREQTDKQPHTPHPGNRRLEITDSNLPGGAHCCRNNADFTLLSMSDSFLSMFGYIREEINTLFGNRFIEMVHPSDRAALYAGIQKQLPGKQDIELEYRVQCKNGSEVWVLDKSRCLTDGNGEVIFYSLLIDITERKQEQEELRLSLDRHQIIMDQATDIIFEWDIRKDVLLFSPNWVKKFGYRPIDTQISERIPRSKNIYADDTPAVLKIMKDTAAGVPYAETEFRIKDGTGSYYWCRIRATTQFDSQKRPIKAVGVIIDIDHEKKQKQALMDMAMKDALTGLYHKAAVKIQVEQLMQQYKTAAMQAVMILDVDNFKMVNDTYGHLAGDSLLSDVAAVMKAQIHSSDVAGRIGGDEFLIYLPDAGSEADVGAAAERLLQAFSFLTPAPGAAPVSCSIGIALFPHTMTDYQTLYQCADLALYARKNKKRGGFCFYTPDMSCQQTDGILKSAIGADVGAKETDVVEQQLAQYAFRMLYAASDTEAVLNRLLEIIGRSYDVSRVYIFESSEDRTCCSNTFEWCADGVEPQLASLQNISYLDDLGDYISNFDKSGIFYCAEAGDTHPDVRAVLEPQGIRSMLQCAMLDEGEFVGYVGFDECRENRAWSPRQTAAFKLAADVFSTFLIKHRQKQKLERLAEPGE